METQPLKRLKLTTGKYTILDDDVFEWASKLSWHQDGYGYATRREWIRGGKGKKRTLKIHRMVANAKGAIQVDHINRNRLDNRRKNLRLANVRQNCMNQGIPKNNTSGYKGVSFLKKDKVFTAAIGFKMKSIRLGRFKNAKDAARAYNKAAIRLYGEFACINEI